MTRTHFEKSAGKHFIDADVLLRHTGESILGGAYRFIGLVWWEV